MKKTVKILFCIALIATVLLGFAAKYDTRGVYPGMELLEFTVAASDGGLLGSSAFYFYRNTFGRTVMARVTTDSQYDFRVYRNTYKQYGSVVVDVRTARPGIATHWDFLNIEKKMTSLYELVSNAGMPVELSDTSGSWMSIHFETVDGYRYTVRGSSTGQMFIKQIRTPAGDIYQEEALEAFCRKVEWFYIGLLGLLTVLLVCLLMVPAAIRRRKTGEAAKPRDYRKLMRNGACALIVLAILVALDAKYQTHGAYVGQEFDLIQQDAVRMAVGVEVEGMQPIYVYPNSYGRIVVVRTPSLVRRESLDHKIFDAVGRVAEYVQTVPAGMPTHLDFFNRHNSRMQFFTEFVRNAGMPEEIPGNFPEFFFETADGYRYDVRVGEEGMAWVRGVFTPEGEFLFDESLDAFTVSVLVQYLVLAAALGGVLVCLLVIPKQIEKRKAKTK